MGSGSSKKNAAKDNRKVGFQDGQQPPPPGANRGPPPPAGAGGPGGRPDNRRPVPAAGDTRQDDRYPADNRGRADDRRPARRPTSAYNGPRPVQSASGGELGRGTGTGGAAGGRGGGGAGGGGDLGYRSKTFDDRQRLMNELDNIADEAMDRPAGPIYNSPSYDASMDYYRERCLSSTQEELDSWFDRELESLKHKTVEDMIRSQFNGYDMASLHGSPQMYEYRLELAALINCFQQENAEWERRNMQMENERQEDLEFLRGLHDRVEGGTRRPTVLDTMNEYSQRKGGPRARGNVYPGAGLRHTYHGEPTAPRPARPLAGSQFSDEADRVMAEYERNRQKAADVRKQDRDRINRELDNYRQR